MSMPPKLPPPPPRQQQPQPEGPGLDRSPPERTERVAQLLEEIRSRALAQKPAPAAGPGAAPLAERPSQKQEETVTPRDPIAAAGASGPVPAAAPTSAPAPAPAPEKRAPAAKGAHTNLPPPDAASPGAPEEAARAGVALPLRRSAAAAWIIAAVAGVGGLTAFASARSELGTERAAHAATLVSLGETRAEVGSLEGRIARLESERTELAAEARRKAEALEEMERTQAELQERLQAEVARGSVLISQQHGELVVDLIDKVVFDSGEAELNEKGRAVLRQVGETLARVPDKVIQVSGHTDHLPISEKLASRFPTNWELSTARATEVVRYLQDDLGLPGNRLVAAGLAEYRPIARNTTKAGRSKNRRIEVRLLPLPQK